MASIYIIENKENGKRYVGKTTLEDPYQRWKQHQYNAKSKYNPMVISDALFKYGVDNFTFYVIETCEDDSVDERERYWIAKFDTYKNGYNSTFGGEGTVRDMTVLHHPSMKEVSKYDLDGEWICNYRSVGLAAKENNCLKSGITATIKGITFQCGGYRWSWKDSDLPNVNHRVNVRGEIYAISENRVRKVFKSQADCAEFIEGDRKKNANVSKSINSPVYNKLQCKGWYIFRDESEMNNFTPAVRPTFTSETGRIGGRLSANRFRD